LQRLAAATADLGDRAEIAGADNLQQRAVEIGGVFDRMRILQMRDVIGGDAVVMRPLRLGVGRASVLGEKRKPGRAEPLGATALARPQRILLDDQGLAGRGAAEKIQRWFELLPLPCQRGFRAIAHIERCGAVHHAGTISR